LDGASNSCHPCVRLRTHHFCAIGLCQSGRNEPAYRYVNRCRASYNCTKLTIGICGERSKRIKLPHSSEEQLVTLRYGLLTPLTAVLGASRLLMQLDQPSHSCVSAMITIHAAAQSIVDLTHTLLAEYGVFGQRLINKPIPPVSERAAQEARYPWAWSLPLGPMTDRLVAEIHTEITRITDAAQVFEQECLASASPQGVEVFRVLSDCFDRVGGVTDSLPSLIEMLIAQELGAGTLADDPTSLG
jgi:hypothetical protein